MHDTKVKLKNGEEYWGPMDTFRPEFGWFTIIDTATELGELRKIHFSEVESAITGGQRMTIHDFGDQDEVERARKFLEQGRQFGWDDIPEEKFDWE